MKVEVSGTNPVGDLLDTIKACLVAAGGSEDDDELEAQCNAAGKKPSDFIRQQMTQLRVVRAAILDTKTGAVYSVMPPGRHHHVINGMVATGVAEHVGLPRFEQGFLLSNGQFARRKPASRIAEKAGQIKNGNLISPPTLTSEDLW